MIIQQKSCPAAIGKVAFFQAKGIFCIAKQQNQFILSVSITTHQTFHAQNKLKQMRNSAKIYKRQRCQNQLSTQEHIT